ncbi:MAG TPA: hypothetical protein PLS86_11720 [Phycisphaerae bacterium]|nr:hypothetical protein [Phycisphaerae bacterium]
MLVDGAGQVAVEQAVLHVGQLRAAFGQDSLPFGLNEPDVAETGLQRLAEPSGVRLGQPDGIQFLLDGSLNLALPPPYLRVSVARSVVAAAVVDVFLAAAILELATNQFTCHGEVAARAAEDATGESNVRVSGPPVAPVENILADVE